MPGRPLLLANAWDAASARAVEAAGFAAVATGSAAVAASLGFADHEAAPVDAMLDAVSRIAGAVSVPGNGVATVSTPASRAPASTVGRWAI